MGVGYKARYVLLYKNMTDVDDVEYAPFTSYVNWLEHTKGYAEHTIEQYSGHVARFLDFLYEAVKIEDRNNDFQLLIASYKSYLLFGKSSEDKLATKVAYQLGRNHAASVESITLGIENAISSFIDFQTVKSSAVDSDNLFLKYYLTERVRTPKELNNIREKDWLAGTIRRSLSAARKTLGKKLFPGAARKSNRNTKADKPYKTKAYPLESVIDLLHNKPKRKTTSHTRNQCIYSLLAASGMRTSECLQLRTKDIDFNNFKIFIRSPFEDVLPGITEEEFTYLSWKGRATEETFLIEPFATRFWTLLKKYMAEVYNSSVNHDFIFQKHDGRPLFTGDRASRIKTFKHNAKKSGLKDTKGISPHSLRHMYGTYVLNYLPIDAGQGQMRYGLSMAFVKLLMGHQSISSTERYAIKDSKVADFYLKIANNFIKQKSIDMAQLKRRFYDTQIEGLKALRERIDDV